MNHTKDPEVLDKDGNTILSHGTAQHRSHHQNKSHSNEQGQRNHEKFQNPFQFKTIQISGTKKILLGLVLFAIIGLVLFFGFWIILAMIVVGILRSIWKMIF